jgi:hypothetical protein
VSGPLSLRTEPDALISTIDLDVVECRRWYELVMAKHVEIQVSGCWIWTGCRNSRGYGQTRFNGKTLKAHRVMFTAIKGEIPTGWTVDHTCRARFCVNPDHLEAVTHRTNTLRGRNFTAEQARRDHCVRGHLLDGENLIQNQAIRGRRNCRACEVIRDREKTSAIRDAHQALGINRAVYRTQFKQSISVARAVVLAVQSGDSKVLDSLRRQA